MNRQFWLILFCAVLVKASVPPPQLNSSDETTTVTGVPTSDLNVTSISASNSSISSPSTPVASNSTSGSNVTVVALSNSTDPHCKPEEKLIVDATNCHVLCSKGALFYYSAGRKPNGTECVVNIYVEGTKHIESSKTGECIRGNCVVRNVTTTTMLPEPVIPTSTTILTTLAPTSAAPEGNQTSTSTEEPSSSSKAETETPINA